MGVSTPKEFNKYSEVSNATMSSFRQLTDASKINVKPDRIRIKTARQNETLTQALQEHGVKEAKMNEHSILNGMQLTDRVEKGTLFKVIEK